METEDFTAGSWYAQLQAHVMYKHQYRGTVYFIYM